MTGSQPPATDFIGRQQEMAVLTAALDDAMSGRGRLVMLAGEPGIGKTRTAQELARHARQQGVRVLWGWCYQGEGAPSYWPWVDSIRTYVQRTEPGLLRKQLGGGAAPIGEMIPEVLEILDGIGPAPDMEPDQARFRLFGAITAFLKRASEDSPVLLVLDDLHWADRPSLLLLEFVAGQLDGCRILVTGTYRDTEAPTDSPLGESLARLARLPSFQRQTVTGLPSEDVASFVQGETGVTPPEPLLRAIHAHTEGNPFFLGEVVRYLEELGRLDEASKDFAGSENLGIPQSIRDVIGQRLLRLSEPCNRALTTASVIGREFDFNLLVASTESDSPEELLDLMDEAISARIIVDVPGGAIRYQFRHSLLQQTLIESIASGRKVRLHARIGEALEEAYGGNPGDRTAELAHHFAQAISVLGNEKMLHYTLLAGERALAAYAHEEGLAHFQRGSTAKGIALESSEAAEDAIAAELLFGLGRSQAAISGYSDSKVTEAVANLKRAFEYYRQSGQPEKALQVAQFPVRPRIGIQVGLIGLIEPAVEMAAPDSPDAARLFTVYGRVLGLQEGRYDEAKEAFSRALAIAERSGDASLELAALASAANVHFFQGRPRDALRASLQAIDLTDQVDDPRSELFARYVAVLCLRGTGNLQDAARHATAMLNLGERIRDRLWLTNGYWMSERVSASRGDWHASRSFSNGGLLVSPAAATLLSTRVMLEYEMGEFDQGAHFLERLIETANAAPIYSVAEHWSLATTLPVVARITGLTDRFHLAEKVAETLLSIPQVPLLFSLGVQAGLAQMAVMKGDQPACEKWYDLFLSEEGLTFHTMTPARLLGLLAHTTGNLDRSTQHFEEALAFCREAGYRPELAWSCHDYAQSLMQNNRRGDQEKAATLLEEGLSIATELGMTPLMDKTAAIQVTMSSKPAKSQAYPDGLTQRETA